ncbi:MAG: hypothetical protein U1F77_06750 [Kiritimatiellia bacterium]
MGLFMALSGVIDAPRIDVQQALTDFAQARAGGLELAQGTTDDPNIGVITRAGKNTTVLYPDGFCDWDDASKELSARLKKTVFSLHIHDGDLWMFLLFRDGEEIGRFNPIPSYWEELSDEDKEKWKGDSELISGLIPTASSRSIAKYFVEWDPEQGGETKAYPDDEFATGDCWQMCDFMKKVGLDYPIGANGSIDGDTFMLWTKQFRLRKAQPKAQPLQPEQSPHPTQPSKPWWKLW